MALIGMLGWDASSGSWTIARPPWSLIILRPYVPSSSAPDRMMPITSPPWARAAVRNNGSTAGRKPFSFGPLLRMVRFFITSRCRLGGAIAMVPGLIRAPCSANATGIRADRARICGRWLLPSVLLCTTTKIAARTRPGSDRTISLSACKPPAEAPITTIGVPAITALRLVQPTLKNGVADHVDAAPHRQLAHGVGFVGFDGLDAEIEPLRDLLVGGAPRDHLEHLDLARAERRPWLTVDPIGRRRQSRLQCPIDIGVARGDSPDGVDQFGWRTLLEQIARGPGIHQQSEVTAVGMARQHEDLDLRTALEQLRRRREAVQSRHGNIHDDDVRRVALDLRDRLLSLARSSDDLHVLLRVEDHAHAFAHGFMIVGEHDAELRGHLSKRTNCARRLPEGNSLSRLVRRYGSAAFNATHAWSHVVLTDELKASSSAQLDRQSQLCTIRECPYPRQRSASLAYARYA